jgi:hypothetical protein
MTRLISILTLVFGIGVASSAAGDHAKPRLMLTESAPGTMSSLQYSLLVFPDRSFHAERATRKSGRDRDRNAYEGQLSESDWSSLTAILDAKDFREMNVLRSAAPLIVENSHPYTISVAREKSYQNVEFLTNESMKSAAMMEIGS